MQIVYRWCLMLTKDYVLQGVFVLRQKLGGDADL